MAAVSRSSARAASSGSWKPRWAQPSSRASRSSSSSSAASGERETWPPSGSTAWPMVRLIRPSVLASSRSPARPDRVAAATPAATARSAWRQAGSRAISSWRACRASRSASISTSASEAWAARGPMAQARFSTRRSRIWPLQLKLFQRPKVMRHSATSLRPSRAPGSPMARRSRSQPNRCSASAAWRPGLERFQGSPPGPTFIAAPASVQTPSRTAAPASRRAGRKSRGKAAKPSPLGREIDSRCGGEPNHSVRPWRARVAYTASSHDPTARRTSASPGAWLAMAGRQPPFSAAMLRA